MLTLTEIKKHADYELGGGTSLPSSISTESAINYAGMAFYNIHQWNFRNRAPVALDFIADQQFITLPRDFGEITAYQMTEGLNFGVTFTTPQQVAAHRATTVTVSQNYYWASIIFPSQVATSVAPPPPRIEIWPTPAADNLGVFTLWYRSKWVDLIHQTSDTTAVEVDDVANIPDYAEAAFLQFVRAFVAGWGERLTEPQGGVDGILARTLQGPVWQAAVATDGLVQSDYGMQVGGAIQSRYPAFTWRSASASPVTDPA